MKISKSLNDIFTVILVVCAIIVTILLVKREFFNENSVEEVRTIDNWKTLLTSGQLIGNKNAPVKIVEFTDFQCPYCRIISKNLETIMNHYKEKVALIVYNFPLKSHIYSFKLAVAGLCASRQSMFKTYYKLIFNYQSKFDKLNINDIARITGLKDTLSFINCVNNKDTAEIVENDIKQGEEIGVNGTPTIIINGKMFVGSRTVDQLETIIKEELR